jgi:putative CocE/NonD family hydrolase
MRVGDKRAGTRYARLVVLALIVIPVATSGSASRAATTPFVTKALSFKADDGVTLHATVGGFGKLTKRPLIVEDSPYAPACCDAFAGTSYNYVQLQWRGTGLSEGSLNSTGSRDQKDLASFLGWACGQPWSDGRIGLYGFSASAIIVYNTMYRTLPCVKAAALMSGTVDLYRDLLYIGGINNTVPGLVVEATIGGPWLENQLSDPRPATFPGGARGYAQAPMDVSNHPTEDAYWNDRTFKGNTNKIPVLADVGFYDVESRGAFEAYRANRAYGSHLLVMGAHDGFANGKPTPFASYKRWFDRYVRGIHNGIDTEPRVSGLMSVGGHKRFTDGHVVPFSGTDWPLPATRYTRYYLSATKSSTARSVNDGTLSRSSSKAASTQTYPSHPSDGFATDPHTISTVIGGAGGLEPLMTDLRASEPTALTYTTAKFTKATNIVGPASLAVFLSSTLPTTDILAVVADVWPDGSSHPVGSGQLRTSFPGVVRSRSLFDRATGDIVQPYTVYSKENPAKIDETREYYLEILPIGNRFEAGHRLRLYIVGASAATMGTGPNVNTVSIGGRTPSRLILPTR